MTYNLASLAGGQNNTKGRYDNLDNFTVVLHCLGKITDADVVYTKDSFNKEWHNKIEEEKDNLKKWEESLQSFLLFEDRPQLFDSQNPSHAAAVKNYNMLRSSKEFYFYFCLDPKPNNDQVQQLIQSGRDWRPNRKINI